VGAAQAKELFFDELVQNIEAGGGVGVPQAARLRERKAQAGHLHVLAMDAVQKFAVADYAKPFGHS
jgi:hypothetical protein